MKSPRKDRSGRRRSTLKTDRGGWRSAATRRGREKGRGNAPPYYVVIFTSRRTPGDHGYSAMSDRMESLAATMPGFLGIESVRGEDGFGITVSYWSSPEAIRHWKDHAAHRAAQTAGIERWYEHYELRVARVERAYSGPTGELHPTAWDASSE